MFPWICQWEAASVFRISDALYSHDINKTGFWED